MLCVHTRIINATRMFDVVVLPFYSLSIASCVMRATPLACVTTLDLLVLAGNRGVFVFPSSPPVGTNTVLSSLVPPVLLLLCPFWYLLSPDPGG